MLATPTILRLALCLSSLAPLTSAWPSWLPEVDSLVVRQDDGGDETSATAERTGEATVSQTEASSTVSETATETDNEDEDEEEEEESSSAADLNTARPTESGTRTGTRTGEPSRTSFDQNDYPGGVQMMTPDPTRVATALFKIGDNVELAWNYTSVKATPTAVDVLISCSVASETWTLTANMTYETEVNYIWDSSDMEPPLLTELYTLIIKDSEAEISDLPEPGYLNVVQGATFGLYHPQPYTALPDWECNTCNTAVGGLDTQALKLALVMTFITICSFTWFTAGLDL